MIMELNFAFMSEMVTRLSLLWSTEMEDFSADMYEILTADYVDWFLAGFRWGQLWSLAFDVKLSA